ASAGPGGTVRPWDGRGTGAAALANRTALRTEVTAALEARLLAEMPAINAAAAAPRKLAMTDLEGAGKQAKRVADEKFGSLATGAVLTSGQRSARTAFAFTAGVNLLDASDPAVRTPDALDLASWMAETDTVAAQKQQDHGFDKARSPEERLFLNSEILAPFVAAHRADLEKFDRFGFAFAEEGPRVLIQPAVIGTATHSDAAPSPGVPSRAERLARWSNWETLVHEYFHTLAHPAFVEAEQGRRVMSEGFCEMFTKEVLSVKVPVAQADGDATLRGGVEGTDSAGALFPGFAADLVPDYDPGSYADYLAHAEGVRDALGGRGPDAVRAAYFQGHVELIGLTPAGGQAPAADRSRDDLVTVPSWVQSVFALSVMTAAPEADILAANPGLASAGPLPRQVHVPGCRQHTVVAATERTAVGGVADRQVESRAEIAAQNGVTEADLNRANPNRDWLALRAGDQILIPRH
ncbi:MAG TPA: LysM domain-containing protein, partial [Micromonosporaceae bacterium]|nr:LysM domain-containing protein [Micromonosporaceae bacterium]